MAGVAETIHIGALSERGGVHIETIRYYERIGLLPRPGRSAGGFRRYGSEDVRRLGFIRRLRELRFSLEQVRELLRLAAMRSSNCAKVRAMSAAHLDEVQAKIKDLRRMEQVLKKMIASCVRGIAPECPMIGALWREP